MTTSKQAKPKGKTPSLIGGSLGTPKECTVLRKSSCGRCHGDILKDQTCHEIPQLGGAFASPKRYCNTCYANILAKSKEDLDALIAAA